MKAFRDPVVAREQVSGFSMSWTVHGNIRDNKGLRRFLLRERVGAEIEYLLACAAHNIDKLVRYSPRWTRTAA